MLNDLFKTNPPHFLATDCAVAIHGDALEVLPLMKSDKVPLIFADPPYNIGKDFGDGLKPQKPADYISWCQRWIDECYRVLHPHGTFYFMAATQFMPYLDVYVSERYHVLCRIVWTYDSSGVQPKKRFGSLHEPILMIVKDPKRYTFNVDDILVEAKTGAKRKLVDYRKTPPERYGVKKVPGNVWYFPRVRYRMKEYENHPSQKPEALMERIILASSNEGDIVLDPFGGAFTTGAVALHLNRRAVSVEINEEYFMIGLRRMSIARRYKGKLLERDMRRKTQNKSKRDHENTATGSQMSLFEDT